MQDVIRQQSHVETNLNHIRTEVVAQTQLIESVAARANTSPVVTMRTNDALALVHALQTQTRALDELVSIQRQAMELVLEPFASSGSSPVSKLFEQSRSRRLERQLQSMFEQLCEMFTRFTRT